MFAFPGGAVTPNAMAGDGAAQHLWLHHPQRLWKCFRDTSFGILVANVCFQFSITIGKGCCCSLARAWSH